MKDENPGYSFLSAMGENRARVVAVVVILAVVTSHLQAIACPEGRFDATCTSECHCQDETCDPQTGLCPRNCQSGWTGLTCSLVCPEGSYGDNCQRQCHCRTSDDCDHVTGRCASGCQPGWKGASCAIRLQFYQWSSSDLLLALGCAAAVGVLLALVVACYRAFRFYKEWKKGRPSNVEIIHGPPTPPSAVTGLGLV